MTRTKHPLWFVVATAAAVSASATFADHLPDNLIAHGKADTTLCGFDPYSTPMKDILARLGSPASIEPWEQNKVNVTYRWSKGPLSIRVNTYQYGDYLDKPPIYIEVGGSDPERLCPTGRGLKLGDDLADVRKLYGRRYQVRREDAATRLLTIQWRTEATIFIDLTNDGHVAAINVPGQTE